MNAHRMLGNPIVFGALVVLLVGCEPVDRRPGAWVSGTPADPPADWTAVASPEEIFVETRTWYGVPHSVTTVVAAVGADLYVPSIYSEPMAFPGNKRWNANIAADPRVRVKLGGAVYELQARPVGDAAEFERALDALAAKYPFWRQTRDAPGRPLPFVLIRMDRRTDV